MKGQKLDGEFRGCNDNGNFLITLSPLSFPMTSFLVNQTVLNGRPTGLESKFMSLSFACGIASKS
jgi:hypothetical protein